MNQYLVISRQTCKICKGCKVVQTPLWGKFETFMARWERRYPEKYCDPGIGHFDKKVYIQNAWWARHGYPAGWATWPTRNKKCDRCRGLGYTEENVDFSEALSTTLQLKLSA